MVVRRHSRRRSGVAVIAATAAGAGAALTLVLAAAAGCVQRGAAADGHPVIDPREAVRRTADVLAEAGTSRTRTSMEMASGGTRITIRGQGGFDYVRRVGRLTVRVPQGVAGAAESEPIIELITPGALYMKNRGAGVPADKWVRVDTAQLSDGNLVANGATDPLTAAELLRGVQKVTYVGQWQLHGTTVRHYRGTTDIRQAAKSGPPQARRQLAVAEKGFSSAMVPFDAYLDEQGRLRRVRHQFAVVDESATDRGRGAGGDARPGIEVTSTTTLYGFGEAVRVDLPEPEDIFAGEISSS